MALYLEVTEGPEKGQRFRLSEGTQIGRTQGTIKLSDPKASGLHAEVELDGKGQLILVDKESFNGLRINGSKVKRIAMLAGVTFQIGKTFLKVVRLFGDEAEAPKPQVEQTSRQRLIQVLEKTVVSSNQKPPDIKAFTNAIELRFIEGVQTETTLTLGYGPRKIGSDCFDVEIEEPISPAIAFEIIPQDPEILFKTNYSDLVLLNGNAVPEQILNNGDRISIGTTLIEVRFIL